MLWVGLQFVDVVFSDHTHLIFIDPIMSFYVLDQDFNEHHDVVP